MADPTGGGARRAHRKEMMKRAHQNVKEVSGQLADAREVYGPKHPIVQKLVADSVSAVKARSEAIKELRDNP